MRMLCALVVSAVLASSPASAVEVTFDGNGRASFTDLLQPGAYIDVDYYRWSDFSITDISHTAPAPAVDYSGWTIGRIGHSSGSYFTGTNTSQTGGEQAYTLTHTVTKLIDRQIAGVEISREASLGAGWENVATVAGQGTLTNSSQAPLDDLHQQRMYFDSPQDSFTVTQQITANGSQYDGLRVLPLIAPEPGTSIAVPAGDFVRDSLLGGIHEPGGIEVNFIKVLTPGTFSATLITTPTSELSQAVLDSLPFNPGNTFTSYEFTYTGELSTGGHTAVAQFAVNYDPETLGISSESIRIFHNHEGEWSVIKPLVYESLGLIFFDAESFSSFSLGQFPGVPEPSSAWLLLLGIPILRRKCKWQASQDIS